MIYVYTHNINMILWQFLVFDSFLTGPGADRCFPGHGAWDAACWGSQRCGGLVISGSVGGLENDRPVLDEILRT